MAITFQCYLIGLLGICFCNPHPMGFKAGVGRGLRLQVLRVSEAKKAAKESYCFKVWGGYIKSGTSFLEAS